MEVEVRFVNSEGASAYADLRHAKTRTSFEVDGYLSHANRNRFAVDRRRDRWLLRALGEAVVRIAADEVWQDLDRLADELVFILTRRAWSPASAAG